MSKRTPSPAERPCGLRSDEARHGRIPTVFPDAYPGTGNARAMANGMSRALAWKTAPGAVRRYSLVSIKSWNCPGCHRDFIVDAEATRDTCPWCNKTVEEKGGV